MRCILKILVLLAYGMVKSSASVTEYSEITAVLGSEIHIPCNVTASLPDDQVTLILWYRGDSGNPIYSVDTRPIHGGEFPKKFANKHLEERATFNITRTQATLSIKPVRENDGGEYRCRVDFRRSRTMNSVMKVIIIVPPKNLTIRDNKNNTLSGVMGPYEEGATVSFICEAFGGRPTPVLTWWKGSTLLDDSYTPVGRGLVKNELLLLDLQREDLLTTLTCQASNTNLTIPVSSSVTIDLSLSPQEVHILTPRRPLSSGEELEVVCHTFGSRPPAKLSWWVGSMPLNDRAKETVSGDGNSTSSRLLFRPTSEDHGKFLVCKAHNPETPDSALDDKWELNVHFAPQLSLALGASQQYEHIREGSDVYFDCNIQANPPVTSVTWTLQSAPLEHQPSMGIIVKNHSLLLQNVGRRHRGKYRCMAENEEGEGVSDEALLMIQFSPVCLSGQRRAYAVAKHEEINVTCEVDADPEDIQFRWMFNNTSEMIDIVTFTSLATRSIASYIPRSKMDYGSLSCWGRNSIGVQKQPCMFSIVPAGDEPTIAISAVLAVLMGLVGALVGLAILIILIMKARSGSENSAEQEESNEKMQTSKLKHFEDDSPDVIPSKPFCTDYSSIAPNPNNEIIYENVGQKEHTYANMMSRVHFDQYDDITYAELALPDSQQPFVRHRLEPPTEYADIDFQNSRGTFPATTVMGNERDSARSPLVISTKAVRVIPEDCQQNSGAV
ncbi:nephrin isoform X4 [Parasteatoda tepidariorum]|uniref:nephrin isoform X4 n=1 Tax=Parasteatoda tepidariorum TaxID=114398 RepID=UPI0039BC630A